MPIHSLAAHIRKHINIPKCKLTNKKQENFMAHEKLVAQVALIWGRGGVRAGPPWRCRKDGSKLIIADAHGDTETFTH